MKQIRLICNACNRATIFSVAEISGAPEIECACGHKYYAMSMFYDENGWTACLLMEDAETAPAKEKA
jgi:hypothetical protein